MKKLIIFLVIVVLLIFLFSLYTYLGDKKIIKNFFKKEKISTSDKDSKSDTEKIENKETTNEQNNIKGSGGGGSSEGGSSSEQTDSSPEFEKFPCGFYYKDYGICTGTCPQGKCVSEGRSCYCKI